MNQYGRKPSLHFLTTAFLALFLFVGSSVPVLATPASRGLAAEIAVSGEAENGEKPFLKLNGEPVLSGRTFFAYSTLETPQSVSAAINLPGLGRVNMSPGTMLSLGFSENSITGKLHAGKIRVISAKGTSINIETPDNQLVNDPAVAGSFTLDIGSGISQAVSESGTVFFNNGQPAGQAQTTTTTPSIWIPVAIYGAIVGAAITAIIIDRSDDDDAADVIVSPVR